MRVKKMEIGSKKYLYLEKERVNLFFLFFILISIYFI